MSEKRAAEPFFQALGALGGHLLQALDGLEWAQRRMHPPVIPQLKERIATWIAPVDDARTRFAALAAPSGLDALQADLLAAAEPLAKALRLFADDSDAFDPQAEGVARMLASMHAHCRAQEALFPLRLALPPVSRFFVEAPFRDDVAALDPEPPDGIDVGLLRGQDAEGGRGGFTLFVPGSYDGESDWPLVVALHGGSGQGRDFLWSWLREARGRRFLLLAPTSRGPTWSFNGPDVDAPALRGMVGAVRERYRVDPERILLTGLSDGATYTLCAGLQEGMPFTALAPLSGVVHPAILSDGRIERASGRRIYMVHGALDWMFPAAVARAGSQALRDAGADLVYREIDDLSHTYARDENDSILRWLDPALALPEPVVAVTPPE